MSAVSLLSMLLYIASGSTLRTNSVTTDSDLNTALISAISNRDVTAVKMLLSEGADPNAAEPVYVPFPGHALPANLPDIHLLRPALLIAVNGAERIRRLTSPDGPIEMTTRGRQSRDAEVGEFPIVKALVNKGADVNAKGYMGRTPLMWALRDGHVRTAHFLMAHGADVKIRDDVGDTSLILAVDDLPQYVGILLKRGVDVNAKGYDGDTALMDAAIIGDVSTARFLLAHGADPGMQDNKGNSAYDLASEHPRMLALLRRYHKPRRKHDPASHTPDRFRRLDVPEFAPSTATLPAETPARVCHNSSISDSPR